MSLESNVFPKSYKLFNQDNFTKNTSAIYIHDLNNFHFKSLRKIQYLTIGDPGVKFENIVNFLSTSEDSYNLDLFELNIDLSENSKGYKIFFELLDFYYEYDNLKLNVVTSDKDTPFDVAFNIFNQYEINNFHNFGISFNLDLTNKPIWLSDNIFKSISKYVKNGFSLTDEKYYVR